MSKWLRLDLALRGRVQLRGDLPGVPGGETQITPMINRRRSVELRQDAAATVVAASSRRFCGRMPQPVRVRARHDHSTK